MRRTLLQVAIGLVMLPAIGLGGWAVWKLKREQERTAEQLRKTQTALSESQQSLTHIEEERQKLSEAYDDLKTHWSQSETELSQLKQTAAQMNTELATLTTDRSELQRQIDESKTQTVRLRTSIESLEREYAVVEAEKTALEGQLNEARNTGLTLAEAEQLQAALARERAQEAHLHEQIVELSRAYEQMAQVWRQDQQEPRRKSRGITARDAHGSEASSHPPPAPSAAENNRLAQRYRSLGDAYLAAYQYPKAADAFERALTLREDATLHAKLAFIYGRMLHDADKARLHTALASSAGADPTVTALGAVAQAQGLPRKSWRLLWAWLTQ